MKLAPCGHPGEPIIGTYVKCLSGCDSRPAESTRVVPWCPWPDGVTINCRYLLCRIEIYDEDGDCGSDYEQHADKCLSVPLFDLARFAA